MFRQAGIGAIEPAYPGAVQLFDNAVQLGSILDRRPAHHDGDDRRQFRPPRLTTFTRSTPFRGRHAGRRTGLHDPPGSAAYGRTARPRSPSRLILASSRASLRCVFCIGAYDLREPDEAAFVPAIEASIASVIGGFGNLRGAGSSAGSSRHVWRCPAGPPPSLRRSLYAQAASSLIVVRGDCTCGRRASSARRRWRCETPDPANRLRPVLLGIDSVSPRSRRPPGWAGVRMFALPLLASRTYVVFLINVMLVVSFQLSIGNSGKIRVRRPHRLHGRGARHHRGVADDPEAIKATQPSRAAERARDGGATVRAGDHRVRASGRGPRR